MDIDRIATGVIRDILWAYQESYYIPLSAQRTDRACVCGEEYGTYPHSHRGDVPMVCEACDWTAKRRRLQERLVLAGLSTPVREAPELDDEIVNVLSSHPYTHPFLVQAPPFVIKNARESGKLARHVAGWLADANVDGTRHSREHVVCFLQHTQAITLAYSQREQEIRDAILWAPVLVYWNNPDGRANGWLVELVHTRTQGLAIIVS